MKHTLLVAAFVITFFSEARSQSWQQTNGPGGGNITSIVVNSHAHIFVVSNAILRSTDEGNSWMRIGETLPQTYYRPHLLVNAADDLFALIIDSDTSASGVWISLDNGNSWQKVLSGKYSQLFTLPDKSINVLDGGQTFSSFDNGNTWNIRFSNISALHIWGNKAGSFFASNGVDFYRSTDKGVGWSKIVNGLPEGILSFAEAPNSDLYVGVDRSLNFDGKVLYKSTDGGRIWSLDSLNVPENFSRYGYSILITSQGRIALSTDNFLVVSDDNGINWRRFSSTPQFIPIVTPGPLSTVSNSGIFYLNYSWTVFRSTLDKSSVWEHVDVPTGYVPSIFQHPTGYLWAGNWLSIDSGKHWHTRDSGTGSVSAFDSTFNILTGTGGIVYRSTDAGLSWKAISGILTNGNITSINVRNDGEIFVSTSTDGIFLSLDNGKTWDQFNYGLKNKQIFSFVIGQNRDMYVGSRDTIYKWNDNIALWEQLSTNFPAIVGNITTMVINLPNEILAGVENAGIFWSTDSGKTWSSHSIGMNTTHINSLISTPLGRVFAATDTGIFFLDPVKGANWIKFNQGLTTINVLSLFRNFHGRLFAGTNICGVFTNMDTFSVTIPSAVKSSDNAPSSMALGITYPNPFSTSTTIPFTIGKSDYISLEVIDMLGRKIAVLVKGSYDTGNYEAKFNRDNLAEGIYFVRLLMQSQSFIKPILIVK